MTYSAGIGILAAFFGVIALIGTIGKLRAGGQDGATEGPDGTRKPKEERVSFVQYHAAHKGETHPLAQSAAMKLEQSERWSA